MYYQSFDLLAFMLTFVGIIAVAILAYVVYRILRNPFHYPYFIQVFDVSRKRNVDIADYIDRFLCDDQNWCSVKRHESEIMQWKRDVENYLQVCRLREMRIRQYRAVLNDEGAFRFETVRDQTRYKQQNYVRTSYKVSVFDSEMAVSWPWLVNRHKRLEEIGFEATLKEYHSKSQRKLLTPKLRQQIKERDNYTCQICGKYMPDEVGLHIDHIAPVAKGGKTVSSNLQVLCSKCNSSKGVKLVDESMNDAAI